MHVKSSRSVPRPSPPEPVGLLPYLIVLLGTLAFVAVAGWQRYLGGNFSPATWYLARASGLTLYLLLWLSTVLGIGLTTKFFDLRLSRGLVYSLHRYTTALGFGFLAIHLLSLAADSFSHYSPADLLIPFHVSDREPWTGFGIIAAWLFVLVAAASPLRSLTGYRFWRFSHWLTFPLMAVAFTHGAGAGTDSGGEPVLAMYVATALAVIGLTILRVMGGRRAATLARPSGPPPLDRLARPRELA
jgi:sulfoxide reductase heme-binding subunit YedZ